MNSKEIISLFDKYVIGNYSRIPIVFVRGDGSWLWDADGRKYLDFFPGWGVNGLGHCMPKVVEAIREQAGKLLHVANNYYMEPQGRFAEMLSTRSFGGKCFFCNSGAEANEAALKLARLATPPGKYKVITFENSFHGRTLAAISATAQPKYHKGLEPIVPGFMYAKFNDLDSVRKLIDGETAGIMLEPIQGEGGVNIAKQDFMQGLREICDKNGLLLIFDEVQTGCGRTGKWFGYQHYGVTPDVMTLAKAIGGGMALGAMVAKADVAAKMVPGTHASTFGGNPIACAAGIAAFEAIEELGLLENARKMGDHFLKQLEGMQKKFPFIKEVRGRGMMIGVELDRPGAPIVTRCMEQGLLINCTHDTVLRMLPSMDISKDLVDQGLGILDKAMAG